MESPVGKEWTTFIQQKGLPVIKALLNSDFQRDLENDHHNYWHLQKYLKIIQRAGRSYAFSVVILYAVVEGFDVLSGNTGIHFSGNITFLNDFAMFQQ
ncbi:hypothetical protein NPIL_488871 [Nephila pilipes]|uniref:Uncharacterized protein n=1 Tax=Nephila pilipes TaxID=299642 RepID=A0A8X6J9X8_NEPPI|nr:hypothetical protein NPIL_488871 [Nephila pilipes]